MSDQADDDLKISPDGQRAAAPAVVFSLYAAQPGQTWTQGAEVNFDRLGIVETREEAEAYLRGNPALALPSLKRL